MSRTTNFRSMAGFTPYDTNDTKPRVYEVASAYGTAIYPGDPVLILTDGTVARTPAGTAQASSTDGITGVCIDIVQYKDANGVVRKNGTYLPASTTWTAPSESSRILVAPAYPGTLFKVRGTTAASSLTVARALRHANCEHSYGTADTGLGLSGAQLVISGAATTALQWRIIEITDKPSNDPLLVDFEAIVMVNKSYGWPVLGDSTTGV